MVGLARRAVPRDRAARDPGASGDIPGPTPRQLEQSVATPIEQQISGVDNMNYMYSVNASNGTMRMFVNFDVKTDPNTDLIFTQMRQNQIQGQLPADVRNYGITIHEIESCSAYADRSAFPQENL